MKFKITITILLILIALFGGVYIYCYLNNFQLDVIIHKTNVKSITIDNDKDKILFTAGILTVLLKDSQVQKTNPSPSGKVIIPILLYHHIAEHEPQDPYYVSPKNFAAQMKWLFDNNYHIITLSTAVEYLQGKISNLPQKPVVITFDDGVRDQYTNAFPMLKKYSYPATFFVKLNNYNGSGMSTDELKEMISKGMEIGSHSVNHDSMSNMDSKTLKYELEESKRVLELDLGINIKYFSYPGGAYSDKTIEAVKIAGYEAAVTVIHSIEQNPQELFQLRRSHIDDDLDNLIERVQGLMP